MDYKELYLLLFRGISRQIECLQDLQRKAEELYIGFEDAPLKVLPQAHIEHNKNDGE